MNWNKLSWAVILILINVAWGYMADNTATQDINRPGAEFAEEREADVDSLFGNSDIPAVIKCSFESTNGQELEVGYKLILDGKVVAKWSGNSSESCEGWSGELEPGDYVFETTSFENIETTISLELQPFEPLRWYGHIILSAMLFLFGGAEILVRMVIPEKKDKAKNSSSLEIVVEGQAQENEGIWQDPIRPN